MEYGLIGSKLGHSYSKIIHGPWGVLSLECVRKLYSPVRSEELGVRSGGAAHKN